MFSPALAVAGQWCLVLIVGAATAPTTRDAAAAPPATATVPSAPPDHAWIMRNGTVVRSGKGALYEPLATLKRGERLTVVGRDPGPRSWLEIEVNGVRGWVYADSLYDRPVDRRTGLELMSQLAFNAAVDRIITALMGREEFGSKLVCRFGTSLIVESPVAGRGWDAGR